MLKTLQLFLRDTVRQRVKRTKRCYSESQGLDPFPALPGTSGKTAQMWSLLSARLSASLLREIVSSFKKEEA